MSRIRLKPNLFEEVVAVKEEVRGDDWAVALDGTTLIFRQGNTVFLPRISLNTVIQAIPNMESVSILSEPLTWGSDSDCGSDD
jgi:hypothetical protein